MKMSNMLKMFIGLFIVLSLISLISCLKLVKNKIKTSENFLNNCNLIKLNANTLLTALCKKRNGEGSLIHEATHLDLNNHIGFHNGSLWIGGKNFYKNLPKGSSCHFDQASRVLENPYAAWIVCENGNKVTRVSIISFISNIDGKLVFRIPKI